MKIFLIEKDKEKKFDDIFGRRSAGQDNEGLLGRTGFGRLNPGKDDLKLPDFVPARLVTFIFS